MPLNIPRFTLFFLKITNRFQAKKCIYSIYGKLPILQYYVHIYNSTCCYFQISGIEMPFFSACVSMLTRGEYGFHGCLVVTQEREFEFKNCHYCGFQDMISIYITQENPLYLHIILLLLKIMLPQFCSRQPLK